MTEKKYTAMQWAAMEGGHSVDPVREQYSFINNEISEARLFRQKNITSKMTLKDTANFAFLNTLLLYILYNEYETAPTAQGYADRTIRYQNFNNLRQAGTDLYNAYYALLGTDGKTNVVHGGPEDANQAFASKLGLSVPMLRKFFVDMSTGKLDPRFVQRFFLRLEKGLGISTQNYRSIRRLVMDWPRLNPMERKLAVTRMLQYFRAGYRRAELYGSLEALASSQGLEIQGAKNAEKGGLGKMATAAAGFAAGYAAVSALNRFGNIGGGPRNLGSTPEKGYMSAAMGKRK